MTRFADLLKTYLNKTPPRLAKDAGKSDMLTLAQLGLDIRRLGKVEMQEFLRIIGMNIRDELVERFENGALRGVISVDAVLGTHLGPRSPNTILTYLYRLAGAPRRRRRTIKNAGSGCSTMDANNNNELIPWHQTPLSATKA